MIQRPPAPRTRPLRTNTARPRLESLAAEFALLTQRRSRALHEIDMLDQQRAAAAVNFARLQERIAWLVQRMDTVAPDLRDAVVEPAPEPPVAAPRARKPAAPNNEALAEIGRKWIAAAQAAQTEPPTRPRRGRRT